MVDLDLSAGHLAMLEASGISRAVIEARGYHTATTKKELEELGFGLKQRRIPALVVPIWNVHGELALHQIRPDDPRRGKTGKALKYEMPSGAQMVLDVPPTIRDQLGDPNAPLFVTEGAKKADAAISAGLCCISLLGVWNFRGTNGFGGKTALPDWEFIALNNRQVLICFDSDVMTKVEVHQAMVRLASILEHKKANVSFIYLPSNSDGSKVGLDDFLVAGNGVDDIMALASGELRGACDSDSDGPYAVKGGVLVHIKPTRDGYIEHPLASFSARIVEEEIRDNGVEITTNFRVAGTLQNGKSLPDVSLPAERFAALNWTISEWGNRAIIYAGHGNRDHVRCAIQTLSGDVPRVNIYTHLGWRLIDGENLYLHGGGAIGANGLNDKIAVSVHNALSGYVLPEPTCDMEEARKAVRASLEIFELAPDRVTFPLLGASYRAALETSDFSLDLSGLTGAGKSVLSGLAQSHYGPSFEFKNLPASFASTANANEALAFAAKDALFVIDDFAPSGAQSDIQRLHRDAARLLRGQGNNAGRGRMRADTSMRPEMPPRGLILMTGEDIPAGQSIHARTLILELKRNDLDWSRVTKLQEKARDGLLAQSMSGFLQWVASRLEEARATIAAERNEWRKRSMAHRRTPEQLGDLQGGLHLFLQYARHIGAITEEEAAQFKERAKVALQEIGDAQADYQRDADPVDRFLRLLTSAIGSGAGHVAAADTVDTTDTTPETTTEDVPKDESKGSSPTKLRVDLPEDALTWGWRRLDEAAPWVPQGTRVGWIRGDDLYLDPEAAFACVQRLAATQHSTLAITQGTLWKRMEERGLLKSHQRDRSTSQPKIMGRQRRVIHIDKELLLSPTSGVSGVQGVEGDETQSRDPAHTTDTTSDTNQGGVDGVRTDLEASPNGTPAAPDTADTTDTTDTTPGGEGPPVAPKEARGEVRL